MPTPLPFATVDVLRDVAALLRYQTSLGLHAVDAPTQCLAVVASPVVKVTQVTVATPVTGASVEATATATSKGAIPVARCAPVSVAKALDASDAGDALAAVRAEIGNCQRCKLCRGRTNIVFGVGSARARLMFVGEGPGMDEDLQGEPFVGAAGQLLDRMIVAMGLRRTDVYIANVVKCRPPRNRDPEPDEVAACEGFLRSQVRIIAPEVLVTLGRFATQTLLRNSTAISAQRGHWQSYEAIAVMPTFHPAYLLRSPGEKKLVWQDLQQVMGKLGLSPPAGPAGRS